MGKKTYRIDIDGTIATPRFFHKDLKTCADWYVREGIAKQEEVASLQFHQQLFLLPHVLLTHRPIEGAVATLQAVAQVNTLQYFTVRQSFDPVICQQVHRNTSIWLEQQQFPYPTDVRFFWDAGHKLLASLEAQEEEVMFIDDRPAGLVKAYEKIAQSDPHKAQQIKQRVTIVAFGCVDGQGVPGSDLRVIPLARWSAFHAI
jgi:hypothetical protein